MNPGALGPTCNLAWVLATSPDSAIREGDQAVQLAWQANLLSNGNIPKVLNILGAAYAEAGRFPEAIATAKAARQLALAQSNDALANRLQIELVYYQTAQPYHEAGPSL